MKSRVPRIERTTRWKRCRPAVLWLENRRLLATILVNTPADDTAPDSTLSLREAIELVDGTLRLTDLSPQEQAQVSGRLSAPNSIVFPLQFLFPDFQSITLTSPLPAITAPVFIDGTITFSKFGNGAGIAIDASGAGPARAGLDFEGGNSSVNNVTIDGVVRNPNDPRSGNGIALGGHGGDSVTGCNLGDVALTSGGGVVGNGGAGIFVDGVDGNSIGGLPPVSLSPPRVGNWIAGNSVGIELLNSSNNQLLGNSITGNSGDGIQIVSGSANVFGGHGLDGENDITSNGGTGISILGGSSNVVVGNIIGGFSPSTHGNRGDGVFITGVGNTIGGTGAGAGNTISFNGGRGVAVADSPGLPPALGNSIQQNSISGNGKLGIDLVGGTEDGYGVTANVPAGSPTGPNRLQPYPVLNPLRSTSGVTTVGGTLDALPNTTYQVDLYDNGAVGADPSGFGQGRTFLSTVPVTTDGTGNATFWAPVATLIRGQSLISATATDPAGNTSEFSQDILLKPMPVGDYYGGGVTNLGIFDATTSTLIVVPTVTEAAQGSRAYVQQFGDPSHKNIPVFGDYYGGGVTNLGIFDATNSTLIVVPTTAEAAAGAKPLIQQFGDPSHQNFPVEGDYYGGGVTNLGIFDATTSTLIVVPTTAEAAAGAKPLIQQFGDPSHRNIPVTGDYYGGGITNLGIFDVTTSTLIVAPTTTEAAAGARPYIQQFGDPSHRNVPVTGDYFGGGVTNLGIFDATTSTLIVVPTATEAAQGSKAYVQQFGDPSHKNIPVFGDYYGGGVTNLGIFDATTSTLIVVPTTAEAARGASQLVQQFGDPSHRNTPVGFPYPISTLRTAVMTASIFDPSNASPVTSATPAGAAAPDLPLATVIPSDWSIATPAVTSASSRRASGLKVAENVLATALDQLRAGGPGHA